MRQKSQQYNFQLKFTRYEAMSMRVNYPPPVVPTDFRIGHRFPKSAMPPPPPPPPPTSSASSTETIETEPPPKQPSIQHNANTRALLLGDLSFLSRPPPTMTVPPPPKLEVPPEKQTTVPTPSLEWDLEKQRPTHQTPTTANNSRTQFLDAVKNRFTSSSDQAQPSESQSLQDALEVRRYY